jgi:hypothetical protein
MIITVSDSHSGVIAVRSYAKPEIRIKSFSICKARIMGVAFDNINANYAAILSEDQSVIICKVVDELYLDKMNEEFKAEGTHLTNIKWNPYNDKEIVCYSQREMFFVKHNKPGSGVVLSIPVPVSEICFIPQALNCNPVFHS